MRFFILGATGGIGRELVQQALSRGHDVTAFVRSPEKVTIRHEKLDVITADVRSIEQLKKALPGHDAVLSSLGHRRSGPTSLLSESARSVVSAMNDTGVQRILVVSVAFLFPETGIPGAILRNLILRANGIDSKAMEQILAESGLDWTVVRPPRLTNAERAGRYRVEDAHLPPHGFSISRADVADFMLNEAERPAHVRQIVGLAH